MAKHSRAVQYDLFRQWGVSSHAIFYNARYRPTLCARYSSNLFHSYFCIVHCIFSYSIKGDVPQSVDRVVESLHQTEVTLVSSATSNEFQQLKALLESIAEWEPERRVVVYDLGLETSQLAELRLIQVRER
jgi:hypothetical protein